MAKPKTAVIVDVDDKAADFLKSLLFQLQFADINKTTSFKEAIEYLTQKRPSYVFIEVDIPDMNIVDVVTEIRTVNERTKIILVADENSPADVKGAINAGASGTMQKPFNGALVKEACINAKKYVK